MSSNILQRLFYLNILYKAIDSKERHIVLEAEQRNKSIAIVSWKKMENEFGVASLCSSLSVADK